MLLGSVFLVVTGSEALYNDLTIAENLRFFATLFGVPRQRQLDQRPGSGAMEIATSVVTRSEYVVDLALENIGRCASFATTLGAESGIGLLPIIYFGTEAAKQKYLPKIASGVRLRYSSR